MNTIKANHYSIFFNNEASSFLNQTLKNNNYSKVFILVDEQTNEYCLPFFLSQFEEEIPFEIIEIESGEENKTIETCIELWKTLVELEGDRKSLMINLGGGVITDLGGFVACTFKRGIDFINVPTTLLSMVDASVGGKNGIDLGTLKNQIGIIKEPFSVLIYTSFLETLPPNEMRSGLAEMLKHGLVYRKSYWDKFSDLNQLNLDDLDNLIHESIEIKNEIVCQDLTENGIRKSLNFGHTIGHAIESLHLEDTSKNKLLHGEAVAIGMLIEGLLSVKIGTLTSNEFIEINKVISNLFEKHLYNDQDIIKLFEYMQTDKKNEYGKIQFALLNGIGNIKINQIVDNELITETIKNYCNM